MYVCIPGLCAYMYCMYVRAGSCFLVCIDSCNVCVCLMYVCMYVMYVCMYEKMYVCMQRWSKCL